MASVKNVHDEVLAALEKNAPGFAFNESAKKAADLSMPPPLSNKVAWVKWYRVTTGAGLHDAIKAWSEAVGPIPLKVPEVAPLTTSSANIATATYTSYDEVSSIPPLLQEPGPKSKAAYSKVKAAAAAAAKKKAPAKKKPTPMAKGDAKDVKVPYPKELLMSDDPRPIGKRIGLNLGRKLWQDCANFYLLEMLYRELHEVASWEFDESVKRWVPGAYVPILHMTDSPHEMLAIEVGKAWPSVVQDIAHELSLYSMMACGGELRHVTRFNQKSDGWDCKHTHSSDCCWLNYKTTDKATKAAVKGNFAKQEKLKDCKTKKCNHAFMGSATEMATGPKGEPPDPYNYKHYGLVCGCWCPHNHMKSKCKKKLVGCGKGGGSCGACSHQHPASEQRRDYRWPMAERVQRYVEVVRQHNRSRGGGWGVWFHLAKRNKAAWMYDCAETFNQDYWGGSSYGGPKWGVAALVTADYFAGILKPQTFIDRMWTLKHNGGPLFNKFYDGLSTLNTVLAVQAEHDYLRLAFQYASPYVRDLWIRNEMRKGAWAPLKTIQMSDKYKAPKDKSTVIIFEQWTTGAKPFPAGFRKYIRHVLENDMVDLDHEGAYGNAGRGCIACMSWTFARFTEYKQYVSQGQVADSCKWNKGKLRLNPKCAYAPLYKNMNKKWNDLEKAVKAVQDPQELSHGCAACIMYNAPDTCMYMNYAHDPWNPGCSYTLRMLRFIKVWTWNQANMVLYKHYHDGKMDWKYVTAEDKAKLDAEAAAKAQKEYEEMQAKYEADKKAAAQKLIDEAYSVQFIMERLAELQKTVEKFLASGNKWDAIYQIDSWRDYLQNRAKAYTKEQLEILLGVVYNLKAQCKLAEPTPEAVAKKQEMWTKSMLSKIEMQGGWKDA